MAQLPRISSARAVPRQTLTSPQLAAQNAISKISLISQATSAAAGVAANYQAQQAQQQREAQQRKLESQNRQAGLQMSRAMVRFEEQFGGREEFSLDEIPESISVRRMEKITGEDGQVMEVPRETVPAYEVAPELYRRFAMNFAESAASGIDDEEGRKEFMVRAEQNINQSYVARLNSSRQEQERYIELQLGADISEATASKQFGVALELAGEISNPEARQSAIQNIKVAQENSYYNDLILEGSDDPNMIPQMQTAIEELRDTSIESSLTSAQRLAKAQSLEAAVSRASAAAIEEDDRAKQLAVSMAWTEIAAGNPTIDGAYVQSMFDDGLIDGPERTRMINTISKRDSEAQRQVATMIDLDRIAKAGYGIDPKDKDARAAVNTRFEEYVGETGDIVGSARRAMQEFKVVPEPIMSMFRAANRADAPNLAQAAALFTDAQDYAPEALADFKEGDVTFIEKVAANMQLGMDISSAVETVRSYDALTPEQKTALRQNAAQLSSANADALSDMVGSQPSYDIPWSVFEPDVPAFMASEFDALVQKNLSVTGYNVEAAQRTAFNTLTRKWRMTDINGDYEIMKNAPNAPTEQLRQMISSNYRGMLTQYTEAYGRKYTPKDIKIKSDSLTEILIRQGKKPTYMAYIVTDPDTQTIEVLDRFEFDPKKAAAERRDQILVEAQESRERALEHRAKIARGEIGGIMP